MRYQDLWNSQEFSLFACLCIVMFSLTIVCVISDYPNGLSQDLNKFLHLAGNDSVIVRMRGLPYNTKASEIVSTLHSKLFYLSAYKL